MTTKILHATALLLASFGLAGPALSQDRPMKLESIVQLVRPASEGAEAELVEPTGVVPGDTLIFTTSYRNEGAAPVDNFVIVNPIAADLLISPEAASQSEVSIDGGKTWGALADLTVAGDDGTRRAATNNDVTHVRWTIAQVAPAAKGEVKFSAMVR